MPRFTRSESISVDRHLALESQLRNPNFEPANPLLEWIWRTQLLLWDFLPLRKISTTQSKN
jgi:hypothetical protein